MIIAVGNDMHDEGEFISSPIEGENDFSFVQAVAIGYENMGKPITGFSMSAFRSLMRAAH